MPRNDLGLYDRLADAWWDTEAPPFRSLHSVNALRVERLAAALAERGVALAGLRVVDLGSGGGIVANALTARGARVVCVDRSLPSLGAAQNRSPNTPLGAVCADIERPPLRPGTADLVVLADVLEHVDHPASVLRAGAELLRPGGHLFAGTLNRTLRSRILAVTLAEGVGLVPRGTHDPKRFIRPAELRRAASEAGLRHIQDLGEGVRVLATVARRRIVACPSSSLAVAYQSLFYRPVGPELA